MELCAGHRSITGNELADRKAKEASGLNTTAWPVSLPRAVSCIILDPEIQRSRTAAVYADHSGQRDRREIASRKDSTLLAQLRSGQCIRLQAYKHFMDNSVDPNCPRCGQAPQTPEHWLDCPSTLHARLEIFGATEALPLLHTLNCSGQVGRTGKTYSVTTWCERHQQQQRQQQQQQQRRRRRRPSMQAVVAAPPTLPRSDERRRG